MRQLVRFDSFHVRHRAGSSWHPLVEVGGQPAPSPAGDEPDEAVRRIFRCDECDLEIIAAAELWQEGTMDW